MVDKLSITIALEGGKQIEQQLKDIGTAGQKAFLDIAKSAEQAGGFKNLKPEEVTAKLKDMGVVGTDAFKKITDAVASATRMEQLVGVVQKVEQGFASLTSAAAGFAKALGPIVTIAIFIATKLVSAMNDAAEAIGKVDAAAIKAGMSIEKFDQLRQGFEAMGLSAKSVEAALNGIAAAAEKSKIAAVTKAFEQLQEASKRGFGGIGTDQLKLLVATAQEVGAAGDLARTSLEKLGVSISAPAQTLQDFITATGDVTKGTAAFVELLRQMPDSANRSALAIDAFKGAGVELVQALRNGIITNDQFKERLGTLTQEMANTAAASEQASNTMNTAWERFKDNLLGGAVWDSVKASGVAAWEAITAAIAKAYDALLKFLGLRDQGPGGATPAAAPGFARGGPIGGSGSGTSDSNLAWVSRGEHIMPARAVSQPGVLAFLEALRRSGGNLSRVLDGMGRFASGGLVGMPALTTGGGGGMSHVTIAFPGLAPISGLRASSDVVGELQRAAAMAQVRSGGRKPSRYT